MYKVGTNDFIFHRSTAEVPSLVLSRSTKKKGEREKQDAVFGCAGGGGEKGEGGNGDNGEGGGGHQYLYLHPNGIPSNYTACIYLINALIH